MTVLIEARFNYRAGYKEKRGRKFYPAFLDGIQTVEIAHVSASEAPVAYRIFSGDPWQDALEVRLHGGLLWWPIKGDHGPLDARRFIDLAKRDWSRASSVLDPLGRTFTSLHHTFEEMFPDGVKEFEVGDMEKQALQVRNDAAHAVFIDDVVHVHAGDPVWYAVFNKETRWSFDLVIGPSSLDRRDREGCRMDCTDRGTRLTSARLGRAFGLNEIEEGLRWLAPDPVNWVSNIVSFGIHEASPAGEVCAIAWSQHLWEVAWRYSDLRRVMPAVADAERNHPPPADLPYLLMLEQFVALEGSEQARGLPDLFLEAQRILARIERDRYVPDEADDDAIASMG